MCVCVCVLSFSECCDVIADEEEEVMDSRLRQHDNNAKARAGKWLTEGRQQGMWHFEKLRNLLGYSTYQIGR